MTYADLRPLAEIAHARTTHSMDCQMYRTWSQSVPGAKLEWDIFIPCARSPAGYDALLVRNA
jgi:hypothetical protein